MALSTGARLGPYEVLSPLGAGGMGEVYRARDTKLGREVAVKAVSATVGDEVERAARFEREAQLLAALNHPHIATVYGLEHSGSAQFLVMELVEGETLADRLRSGALPIAEVIAVAAQIADALQAAHDKGIIHRDLKPANIALTKDGQVKVLDFGLAKALDPSDGLSGVGPAVTRSPTLTLAATQAGVVLGTAAYMSPEQAKGRAADKRSDMWAFGCVLYEMLTGTRAFDGEDVSDTMAAVLRAEPDWNRLPARVPPALRTLAQRCLEKDRRLRIVDAGAALFVLREFASTAAPAVSADRARRSWRRTAAIAAAVLLGAVITGAGVWIALRPEPPRIVRFDITPNPEAPLTVGPAGINLVISPDGKRIAYHARHQVATTLDMRSLDTGESTALQQTEAAGHPTFSPDGSHLAFFKAGKLFKLGIDSRVMTALAEVADGNGVSWGTADTIVFTRPGPRGGLFRIAAGGGKPELLASPDTKAGEQDYTMPELLPDAKTVLFVIRSASAGNSRLLIAARSLESAEQKVIVEGAVSPRYAGGYLLYVQGSVLTGVRFDAARLAIAGEAVPLVNGIISKGGVANFSVSRDGTLTYIPGSTVTYVSRFIWKDRDGRTLGTVGPSSLEYPRYARISPDGRRFVATTGPAQEGHIWVFDVAGAARPNKLTFEGHNTGPIWSPDGSRVAFVTTRDGPSRNLYSVAADGSVVEAVRLVTNDKDKNLAVWSKSGWIVFTQLGEATRQDLWRQLASADGKSEPWLATGFAEASPALSPDEKWLAYVSDQTGTDEIWVRPFPGPGSPVRVSSNGGHDPVWSRNGKELFYQEGAKMMAAEVGSSEPLQFRIPHMLFEGGFIPYETNTPRTYDVAADGRFLMVDPSPTSAQRFNVVINWVEELKRLVPSK